MLELVIRPLADAFLQVGVFVALLVAPFGWARYRWGDRFDAALAKHRRLGPLVAALMTVPPGCGGAIIVMAVYSRGAVSFGAAIAALVATMGDATWVLLAADPVLTLQLKVLLVAAGTITGVVVDLLGIDPKLRVPVRDLPVRSSRSAVPVLRREATPPTAPAPTLVGGGAVPATMALGSLPTVLWLVLGAGLALSLPVTFQLLDPAALGESLFAGVDPYLLIGTLGTGLCALAFVRDGCKMADDDTRTADPGSMTEVLRHGGREVAFVTLWVAAAYLLWSVFSAVTGFDGSQLPLWGVAGVFVGAAVGLIPGCAIQIVFAGIFLAGGMPLSTLAANSVSQDGDALIPLFAFEQRSALLATVITTIPAIVLGLGLLFLG